MIESDYISAKICMVGGLGVCTHIEREKVTKILMFVTLSRWNGGIDLDEI